ncbi:MAG: hypothetical protein PHC28_06670 [Flavobacterium sp.]|nr:hypothetical protein [Flavobacterium sp.]
MKAKLKVVNLNKSADSETINFVGVSKSDGYDETGLDENNTFAKYTPCADLRIVVTNPALFNTFEIGQEYYLDFVLAKNEV